MGNGKLEMREVNNLRTKMRMLARLVMEACDVRTVNDVSELLEPDRFEQLVSTAKTIIIENPQLGLTVGNYIKQVASLKIGMGMVTNPLKPN